MVQIVSLIWGVGLLCLLVGFLIYAKIDTIKFKNQLKKCIQERSKDDNRTGN